MREPSINIFRSEPKEKLFGLRKIPYPANDIMKSVSMAAPKKKTTLKKEWFDDSPPLTDHIA
jgi:hypothetical protein